MTERSINKARYSVEPVDLKFENIKALQQIGAPTGSLASEPLCTVPIKSACLSSSPQALYRILPHGI